LIYFPSTLLLNSIGYYGTGRSRSLFCRLNIFSLRLSIVHRSERLSKNGHHRVLQGTRDIIFPFINSLLEKTTKVTTKDGGSLKGDYQGVAVLRNCTVSHFFCLMNRGTCLSASSIFCDGFFFSNWFVVSGHSTRLKAELFPPIPDVDLVPQLQTLVWELRAEDKGKDMISRHLYLNRKEFIRVQQISSRLLNSSRRRG